VPGPAPLRVALAAPTGKAAARLRQSIDQSLQALSGVLGPALDVAALSHRIGPARTLHALLGASPHTRRFRHHAAHPVAADLVIIDEASMVHLEMMAALLQALPSSTRLVLIGDKDQLASVEAGAVLGDLCGPPLAARYDRDTARFIEAATGETLPPESICQPAASAGAQASLNLFDDERVPTALAEQTIVLEQSHRFSGPIAALARAVNDAAHRYGRHFAGVCRWPRQPVTDRIAGGQRAGWRARLVSRLPRAASGASCRRRYRSPSAVGAKHP
jgi:exodeoxyribonuclease V alpha subunit